MNENDRLKQIEMINANNAIRLIRDYFKQPIDMANALVIDIANALVMDITIDDIPVEIIEPLTLLNLPTLMNDLIVTINTVSIQLKILKVITERVNLLMDDTEDEAVKMYFETISDIKS